MIHRKVVVMMLNARNLRTHSRPTQHYLEYQIASITSTLVILRNAVAFLLLFSHGSNMTLEIMLKQTCALSEAGQGMCVM